MTHNPGPEAAQLDLLLFGKGGHMETPIKFHHLGGCLVAIKW